MNLQISYFEDTDTLSIWNGEPTREADDVAENLIVDLNASGSPVGLTLEHAAELCLPELLGTTDSPRSNRGSSSNSHSSSKGIPVGRGDMQLHIDYHQQSDTLWLGNGLPTPSGEDIVEYVTAFLDDDRPNAVSIKHATEVLLPILQLGIAARGEASEQPGKPAKTSP